MHVIVNSCANHVSLHLPTKTRFPENGSLLLIGQFEGMQSSGEQPLVGGGIVA